MVWDDRYERQFGFFRMCLERLSAYLKSSVKYDDAVPGGVIAVQIFGDFQNFNAA